MAEPPADVTSEFFRGELERALQENGFAIMAWEVMDDAKSENYGSPAHAEATVELLPEQEEMGDKGHSVTIRVTLQGYSVGHYHTQPIYIAPAWINMLTVSALLFWLPPFSYYGSNSFT